MRKAIMPDEALTTRARDVAQKVLALSPHAYGPEWWPGRTGDEATDQIAAFGRECREAGAIAALEPANYSLGAAWKQKAEQEKARADEAVVAAERQYDQAVEATQRALQAEERADALQNLIFAKDDALLAAHARVRALEGERDEPQPEYDFSKATRAYEKVTRFEVIDKSGRVYTKRPCGLRLSLQDDGRTMKVFLASDDRSQP
jgi:hypothetical protein